MSFVVIDSKARENIMGDKITNTVVGFGLNDSQNDRIVMTVLEVLELNKEAE